MMGLRAWQIVFGLGFCGALCAQETPRLSELSPEVNSLVMNLAESQIAYMQPLLRQGPAPWTEQHLEAFRGRVTQATLRHPDVLSARAARKGSQYGIREALAGWLPQVSAQMNQGKINNDPSSILGTPARQYNNVSFNVTVRQLVYDFGATSSSVDSNTFKDRQNIFRQQQAESDVALRSIQAYHEWVRAHRQWDLAVKNQEARQSILDLVQQRHEIGGGTLSDVVRAQSRLADALANATSYQKNLGSVQAAYREFFGDELPPEKGASPVFDLNVVGDWTSELGLAGQTSWKVRIAQAARDASQADLKNTRAKGFASINLEVSSTRRDWVSPAVPGTDQSVALVARQALYTGGADTARIDQAAEKLNQAMQDLASAELEYRRQIEQLMLEVETARRLIKTRQQAVTLAADSLRMIREQYAYRRGTLLDLLTAQETLYFASRELIDAQVDGAMSNYKMLSLSGLLNRFVGLSMD